MQPWNLIAGYLLVVLPPIKMVSEKLIYDFNPINETEWAEGMPI